MTNARYAKGREAVLKKLVDFENDEIRVYAVDTGAYTVDLAADEFLADIPSGAREGFEVLTNVTVVNGVIDADDVVFAAMPAGDSVEALVLVQWVTAAADSRLLAWIDTATGLPFTPADVDVNITWDSGANKIVAW